MNFTDTLIFMRRYKRILIASGILIFTFYAIFYSVHNTLVLKKKGRWTIAKITEFKNGGRGGCWRRITVVFNYKDKLEERTFCVNSNDFKKCSYKNRYFIKFIPNEINSSGMVDFIFDYTVPDTLNTPTNGWNQEWMQVHFPDVVKDE